MSDVDEERKRKHRHKHKSREGRNREKSSESDDSERTKKKKRKERKKEKKRRREEEHKEVTEPVASSSKKRKKRDKEMDEEEDIEAVLKKKKNVELEDPQTSRQSANAWENVDMGDIERKEKFLRLMGATRQQSSEQSGNVVGNAAGENTKHLSEDMERQYQAGIDQRYQRHSGLGFSQGSSGGRPSFGEAGQSSSSSSTLDDIKKKFSMNFVKSSNT